MNIGQKKRILIQAKKYKSNKKWKQNCHQSFYIAKKMGWITEAQQYLMNAYKLNILSKEEVFTEALKYPINQSSRGKSQLIRRSPRGLTDTPTLIPGGKLVLLN